MKWTVEIKKQAAKKIKRLPRAIRYSLFVLMKEIEEAGPGRGNWPNYSKLENNVHHCHLKKGKPTYVAVWEVLKISRELQKQDPPPMFMQYDCTRMNNMLYLLIQ